MCESLYKKVAGLQLATLLKKRLQQRCFLVSFRFFLEQLFPRTHRVTGSEQIQNFLVSTEAVIQRCSVKNVFLIISQNSQENTCARVSFLIKLQACKFIKKETLAQAFPVNFAKFLRTTFLQNTSGGCFCMECWLQRFIYQLLHTLSVFGIKDDREKSLGNFWSI